MILIADSGSTKTTWVAAEDGTEVATFRTQGINPFFQDEVAIEAVFRNELLPQMVELRIDPRFELFYYGAGCSSTERCEMVLRPLQQVFPEARITVDHDLLGAARALCGREAGIAGILGTGSNSCFFDGKKIMANNPSLGFILGDEGSGGHIGKELLKMYVYHELEAKLHDELTQTYELSKEKILHAVYYEPLPNRYCASFMPFVGSHKDHPSMIALVSASFHEYFKRHISKYSDFGSHRFSCLGSVAMVFRPQLEAVAAQFGMSVAKVLHGPVEGLIAYHSGKQ